MTSTVRNVAIMSAGAVAAVEAVRFNYLERSEHHTLGSALFQLVCYDILHVLGGRARKAHDADCAAFGAVQREVLIGRLAANLGTAYGKDHDFASILALGQRCPRRCPRRWPRVLLHAGPAAAPAAWSPEPLWRRRHWWERTGAPPCWGCSPSSAPPLD